MIPNFDHANINMICVNEVMYCFIRLCFLVFNIEQNKKNLIMVNLWNC